MPFIKPKLPLPPVKIKKQTLRSTQGKRYSPLSEVTTRATIGGKTIYTTRTTKNLPSGLTQKASSQRIYSSNTKSCPTCGLSGRNIYCPTCAVR